MSLEAAERAVREGDLDAGLSKLQEQIRKEPANPALRVFLFQLLCIMGQWERAQTQLSVAADLDAGALAMVQMYREAVRCELLRGEVFSGKKSPLVFGEPAEWLALLIESLLVTGTPTSSAEQAQSLRERAFEAAPPSAGSLDGRAFEWIADADMRLGPVCEAVINGRYYWVPFERLSRIDLETPTDLRDVVWMPAHFQFTNGGEAVGVIPTRYPGSEAEDDPQIRLGRKTVWREDAANVFSGLGQRIFTTDTGEDAVMDVRTIVIEGERAGEPQAVPDA
ncbi:MAG: virulence protein SciE type [Luteitalea sp.]|nr:virulence protein SciE type [Luteitalea sp.]